MEGHTICLQCDKFQYEEGVGVGGGTVQAMGRPRFCLVDPKSGEGMYEGNADVKKNREFTQQTWGLSGGRHR